jgi:hypothetical protein
VYLLRGTDWIFMCDSSSFNRHLTEGRAGNFHSRILLCPSPPPPRHRRNKSTVVPVIKPSVFLTPSRIRPLVAGLSVRRPGFDLRAVRFVVEKVALGQVFSPSTSVFPCQHNSINGPFSSSSKCMLIRRTNARSPGAFQKSVLFQKSVSVG